MRRTGFWPPDGGVAVDEYRTYLVPLTLLVVARPLSPYGAEIAFSPLITTIGQVGWKPDPIRVVRLGG